MVMRIQNMNFKQCKIAVNPVNNCIVKIGDF